MASGHVNRKRRPNTWLLRPNLRRAESPCRHGAVHTWHKADIGRDARGRQLSGAKQTFRTKARPRPLMTQSRRDLDLGFWRLGSRTFPNSARRSGLWCRRRSRTAPSHLPAILPLPGLPTMMSSPPSPMNSSKPPSPRSTLWPSMPSRAKISSKLSPGAPSKVPVSSQSLPSLPSVSEFT